MPPSRCTLIFDACARAITGTIILCVAPQPVARSAYLDFKPRVSREIDDFCLLKMMAAMMTLSFFLSLIIKLHSMSLMMIFLPVTVVMPAAIFVAFMLTCHCDGHCGLDYYVDAGRAVSRFAACHFRYTPITHRCHFFSWRGTLAPASA